MKNVQINTLPNGYSLQFDGQRHKGGYMYFSLEDLLKGFMIHIGLNVTEQLSMDNIDDFITSVINWKDNSKCVKEIQRLQTELDLIKHKRNSLARQLISERAKHIELVDDVKMVLSCLRNYPDKDVIDMIDRVIRGKKQMKPITLSGLGIKSNDVIAESEDYAEPL